MNAFLPHELLSVTHLAALLVVEFLAGYGLQYANSSRFNLARTWISLVIALFLAHWITLSEPAGFRMMAVIAAGFLGMKAVVGAGYRAEGGHTLSFGRWTIFAVGWPGMNPRLFSAPRRKSLPGAGRFAANGFLCGLTGAALMLTAGLMYRETNSLFLVTVVFFIGSSLLVHYGLFTLSAAFWRNQGFDCGPLFLNPFSAQNLGEFWGRKWNLAFHEMTATAIYRPLSGFLPRGEVLLISFGLSGILHEAVISLPVKAGYGLPLGYFLLHGILVAAERFLAKRGLVLSGWLGRLWTIFWVILPLPFLFHRPFLAGVVWSLIGVSP